MKIQEHLDKISWSFADKVIFVLYGLVTLFQINLLEPHDFGLFALLINLLTWIFIISDSFALQNLIQFGVNKDNRARVNLYTLILHLIIVMGISVIIFITKNQLSTFFNEQDIILVAQILPVLCLLTIPRTYAIKLCYRDQNLSDIFWIDIFHFGGMTVITAWYYYTIKLLSFDKMVIIYTGGTILGSLFAIWIVRKKLIFSMTAGTFRIKHLVKFGSPMLFSSGLHSLPRLLDVYFVQYFFGTAFVGIYSSAKTLYRIFDETANATYGLIYPTAVRQIEYKNITGIFDLITKSISFLLMSFLVIVILLESGFSSIIISTFLPQKYQLSIPIFNLMIIAAIGLPFVVSSLIITAEGKPHKVLLYTFIASVITMVSYYLLGSGGYLYAMPVGLIIYNFVFGFLCYLYLKKKYNLPVALIFRAAADTINFIRKR